MIHDDFTVRVVDDLPADGMVMDSPDGHHNIYINGKLDTKKQRDVCVHELAHILVYDHSKEFYDVVYKYYPNYKECHTKLRKGEFK